MSGLSLVKAGSRIVAYAVNKDSPAFETGARAGSGTGFDKWGKGRLNALKANPSNSEAKNGTLVEC